VAVAVSHDGTTVAAFRSDQDGVIRVFIGAASGKELQRYDPSPFEAASLTNTPRLAFSPDGKQLLLFRNAAGGRGEEAWVLPVPANAANPPRRVLEGFRISNRTSGVSWMPDNRHVVLGASTADEPSHLFMADTVSGAVDALTSGTKPQAQPAVSPDGMMVALRENTSDYDIVSIDLATGAVKPVIATQRNEYHPMWSRQDPGMAYVTDRNGQLEIWIHKPGQARSPTRDAT
jgi:Tol biopolymer transport system component